MRDLQDRSAPCKGAGETCTPEPSGLLPRLAGADCWCHLMPRAERPCIPCWARGELAKPVHGARVKP